MTTNYLPVAACSLSRSFKAAVFLFLTCLMAVLTVQPVSAQFGLGGQDASQVRSADITDAQLRSAAEQARAQGFTMDQALELARQRGLPAAEAQRLRQRIIGMGLNRGETEESGQLIPDDPEFILPERFIRPQRRVTEQMRMTFGSDIFQEQATEFSPMQNMATPASYTLGPGDQLVVNIWGDQTNLHQLTVSPEGTVDIDNLGPVYVSGLNITEANDRIIESLQQIYAGLRPGSDDQTTYARISINRLRTIQVALTGDVVNPGDYSIYSNSTVFNALYRAGGPDENGSYRTIRVIRNNEVAAVLDLYDYLVDGMQENNIRLRDQDVIHISPYRHRVFIEGEVKRDGLYYEMQDGETLDDLIRFAGYFTDRAYTGQINVRRNTPTERRIIGVDQGEFTEFEMASGDEVIVDEILDRFENRVTISGAVWRSGEFELRPGMTLHDLILEAQGVRPDAFMSRGLVNRMRDDYSYEQLNFDVAGLMENPDVHDIPLQREDHVQIRSIQEMIDEQTVQVRGAVHQPGTFNYRDNMTLEDLILQADGLTDAASEARIEISRRITGEAAPEQRGQQLSEVFTFDVDRNLRLNPESQTFHLQPFDWVYVYRRPDFQEQQTVSIEGQVMYPGTYPISSRNERISGLVSRAGGLTNEAYLPGARLVRQYASIDRPEIELDFLTSEDVVNPELLGQGGLSARNQEAMRRDSLSDEGRREETGDDDERQGIEQRRTELNRQDFLTPGRDSTDIAMDDERDRDEIRIPIDLAAILQRPGSSEDLFLREGDVLLIPEEQQTVAIAGAVMQRVEVRYRPGLSLRHYIDQAGGYAENARKGRIYVVSPNGDVDRRKQYLLGLIRTSPDIEPGSQIIIPAKTPRERMDMGELISISAAIVGMTTSLIIALDRLSR